MWRDLDAGARGHDTALPQITGDHATDVAIPGAKYTFGVVIDAQAAVLQQRGRRALRVHLGSDVAKGPDQLGVAMVEALNLHTA